MMNPMPPLSSRSPRSHEPLNLSPVLSTPRRIQDSGLSVARPRRALAPLGLVARVGALALAGWLLAAPPPALAQALNLPVLPGGSTQSFAVNDRVDLTLPTATGGTAPYTYTLEPFGHAAAFADGVPGLTFDAANNRVVGTPTSVVPAGLAYRHEVSDSAATPVMVSVFYGFIIAADTTDPAVTYTVPGALVVGTAVMLTPVTTDTDIASYALGSGTLPPGLDLATDTGIISGAPTTLNAAITDVTITVTDTAGNNADVELTFPAVTAGPPPDFGSASQANLTYGRNTAIAAVTLPEATGATSYSLNPASPLGLDFDAATRALSGTPTDLGTQAVTYTATNAFGSAVLNFSITVIGPDFTAQPDLTFAQNVPVDTTLPLATGVTSSFPGYSIVDATGTALTGGLTGVPGLTFTAATTPGTVGATLSGAPTTVGSYPITYEVEDIFQVGSPAVLFNTKAFLRFNIVVVTATPPVVSYTVPTTLEVGTAVRLTPSTTDTDISSYAVDSGTPLPPGLTLDTDTGIISGTLTTTNAATTDVTINVTDTQGAVGTAELTFPAVTPTALNLPQPDDISFFKGDTLDAMTSVTLPDAIGGTTPYTFTLTGPAPTASDDKLPDGVRFQHASAGARVVDGTPTTSGGTEVTYTVTDTDGETASVTFTITILGPTFPSFSVPVYGVEEAINLPLPIIENGNIGSVSYRLSPLPSTLTGLTYTASADPDGDGFAGRLTGALTMPVSEELVLTATDAHDGDTGSLTFTITVSDAESPDAVNRMVLPEVARAIAGPVEQVVSGAASRGAANFGGQSSMAGFVAAHGKSLLNGDNGGSGVGALKSFLGNADFVLPLNNANAANATSGGTSGLADNLALWGNGDYRNFSVDDGDFDWDGDLFSAHLGMDTRLHDDLLGGFALSWSQSEIEYGDDNSEHEMELITLSPYLGWQLPHEISVWATAGYGRGDIKIREDGQQSVESDVTLRTVGGGISRGIGSLGSGDFRLKGDASHTDLDVEGSADIAQLDVEGYRLRLIVEGSHENVFAGGRLLKALEAGVRYDGGDGATGAGAEVGGRVSYSSHFLTIEGNGWVLVAHSEDVDEWGAGGSIWYHPFGGGVVEGLSLSLSPSYGSATSGISEAWTRETEAVTGGQAEANLDAELKYGIKLFGGMTTSYGGARLAKDTRDWRLGWKIDGGLGLMDIGLEALRKEAADRDAEHIIELKSSLSW